MTLANLFRGACKNGYSWRSEEAATNYTCIDTCSYDTDAKEQALRVRNTYFRGYAKVQNITRP